MKEPVYRTALALMTNVPALGQQGKLRFSPPLTTTEEFELRMTFLRDMFATLGDVMHRARGEAVVFCLEPGKNSLKEIVPEGFKLFTQTGKTLGKRMECAVKDLIQKRFPSVCLINPDCPTLPRQLLEAATDTLARPEERLVLGPTEGGGCYLVGVKQSHEGLFDRVSSTGANLIAHMTTAAAQIGLRVEMLPTWYEVSDVQSLNRLCEALLRSPRRSAGRRNDHLHQAPYTHRYLATLLENAQSERVSKLFGKS